MASVPAEPARWPKVVGTISICWGGFNLLCGACGMSMIFLMGTMTAQAEKTMGPMPDVMKPNMAQIIVGFISFIAPVILLIAGIATVKRRPAGRSLHLTYAVISIVLSGVATVIGFMHQMDVLEWAKHNQSDKWAKAAGSPFAYIGIAVGLFLGMAWPFFCMIWFGAIKRDNRDLDGAAPQAVI